MHLASDTQPVVHIKADTELGYAVINADDFDPGKHTKFEGSVAGKGPSPDAIAGMSRPQLIEAVMAEFKARIEITSDEDLRAGLRHAFDVELDREVVQEHVDPAQIPPNWETLHWTKRVKLAQALLGSDDTITAEAANQIIAEALATRQAA